MLIQVLLVIAIVTIGWTLFRGPGSSTQRAFRKLFAAGISGAGALFVLFPDLLTRMANLVGVGRGTDLLLYSLVVVFGFTSVACYQRIFQLERRLETITRALALRDVTQARDP